MVARDFARDLQTGASIKTSGAQQGLQEPTLPQSMVMVIPARAPLFWAIGALQFIFFWFTFGQKGFTSFWGTGLMRKRRAKGST